MKTKFMRLVAAGTLVSGMAAFSGCATVEQLDEVRKIAEDAKSSADSALQSASQGQQMARDAQSSADQAMRAAEAAQACCNANSERMERMFQRSMAK